MWAIIGYVVLILAISSISALVSSKKRDRELREKIQRNWGVEVEEKYTDDDLKTVSEYFNNKKAANEDEFFIDDITWNDLNMDSIFKKINTTESSPGEQFLYNILREPLFDLEELKKRDELINYFDQHKSEREKIKFILARLGKKRSCYISDYFYNKDENRESNLMLYRVMSITPFICIAGIYFNAHLGVLALLVSIFANIATYYDKQRRIYYKLEAFKYIMQIICHAKLILKEDIKALDSFNLRLKEAFSGLKDTKLISFSNGNNGTDVSIFNEYTGMVFLRDLIKYEKMSDALIKKSEEFKTIFDVLGTIDSLIAIASYRRRVDYVIPELIKSSSKKDQATTIKDMVHPLIEKSIPNSLETIDSVLITGSNASGKSTFLKTLAINIIFAQTIYTTLTKEFKCSFFKVYTSMALKDDIFSNESYYIVETKSLKRIIDGINNEIPTICFVDEILRGTNTVERIAASSQVLKYLTLNNCICIAATHDVELTHILEKYFTNYHFQEKIENNEITFDYKMYKGRATTKNAIKLLKILGYSNAIVEKAEEKANKFLNNGVWEVE